MRTLWHENDELWAELLPVLCGEELLKAAPTEAAHAATLLQVKPGASILDLGCGPGRHSVELARLGYRVTGVDRTAAYLSHACQRALEAVVQIEFVQENMLGFRRETAFDGAINLLTSFGYFEHREEDLVVLRNVYASVKPGARFVIDMASKEFLARTYTPKHWQEVTRGRFWLAEREVLPGWEKLRAHWVFVGGGETREFTFEHRVYSGVELADLMRQAGFAEIGIYGGLDGRPYNHESNRLVIVGKKTA
jgi:SAM-dependent methyltransferase